MISWSLTLTGHHINILRAMKDEKDHGQRESSSVGHRTVAGSHYITYMRILAREGLVVHKGANEPYRPGYTGFHLTKRGEFILDMVEQDIAKYLSVKPKSKTLKLAVPA